MIQSSERAELIAVASRSLQSASTYASQWSIPVAYGSYEELLQDPQIDVVYIPLPNHLHAQWSIRAMRSGKHVLCEKPLCLTTGEWEMMRRVSDETGKVVAEAFMYLHHPQTAVIKDIIDQGHIGTLKSMYGSFSATITRPADNYRFDTEMGGGALWDVGVYPVSLFQYVTGTPAENVKGRCSGDPVDMHFWGMLEYPGNVVGQFYASFEAQFSTHCRFTGTSGILEVTHPFINTDACRAHLQSGDDIREVDLPKSALYAGEVEDMNSVVLDGENSALSLEISHGHINTVLRLHSSAARKS